MNGIEPSGTRSGNSGQWRKAMDKTSDWTCWYCLEPSSKESVPSEIQERFGIYQIRIVDANGCPIRLGRMLKCDESGVVYIGRSGVREEKMRTVAWRLKEWLRRGHSGAETYARVVPDLPHNHSLEVRALYLPVIEVCKGEAEEIEAYRKQFGEPPPFNSNLPGKKLI